MSEPLCPCFKCVYAEALENEPNIECQHPLVKKFKERAIDQGPLQRLAIELNIQGPRGGWPFNYSPEWIESCNGFATEKPEEPKPEEAKDVVVETKSTKVEETEKVEEEKPAEEEKKEDAVEPEEKPVEPDDDSEPFTFGKTPRKSGKGK